MKTWGPEWFAAHARRVAAVAEYERVHASALAAYHEEVRKAEEHLALLRKEEATRFPGLLEARASARPAWDAPGCDAPPVGYAVTRVVSMPESYTVIYLALPGDVDVPGGFVIIERLGCEQIRGIELLPPETLVWAAPEAGDKEIWRPIAEHFIIGAATA